MKLFRRIYIKSAEDLPKKVGDYHVHDKNDNENNLYLYVWDNNENLRIAWLKNVDWYFEPYEISDEEIYNYIRQRRHEALYPQEGNMSINRITLSEMEWMNICLELAKAFRDGSIKS